MHPINVPDLSSESPLTISGRYSGKFPEVVKARGIIADMTCYEMDLKVHKAKAIPLDKVSYHHFISLIFEFYGVILCQLTLPLGLLELDKPVAYFVEYCLRGVCLFLLPVARMTLVCPCFVLLERRPTEKVCAWYYICNISKTLF